MSKEENRKNFFKYVSQNILGMIGFSCYVLAAYVGDNTDVIQMNEALKLIRVKLVNLINNLKEFSLKYKDVPTLGFTHFQAAQLTTVGKRATLWAQDLILDLEDLNYRIDNMKLRGVKGTTGTQASFLSLFEGDHQKVSELDKIVCKKWDTSLLML